MPPIDWAAIIAEVIAAIQACIEKKRPTSRIRASILSPEPGDEIGHQRIIRKALGLGPLEFLLHKKEIMAQVNAQRALLGEDGANELIEQAQALSAAA